MTDPAPPPLALVHVGPLSDIGLWVPSSLTSADAVFVDDETNDAAEIRVDLRLRLVDGRYAGRYAVHSFQVRAQLDDGLAAAGVPVVPEITADLIRNLPIAGLIGSTADRMLGNVRTLDAAQFGTALVNAGMDADRARRISDRVAVSGGDDRPRIGHKLARLAPSHVDGSRDLPAIGSDVTLTDEESICVAFTVAKLIGRDTNVAVAEHLSVTPQAAAQRIRRLRERRVLPPAESRGARR